MSKKSYKKKDYPVEKIRRFLEPGPVVLLSSAHRGRRDVHGVGTQRQLSKALQAGELVEPPGAGN